MIMNFISKKLQQEIKKVSYKKILSPINNLRKLNSQYLSISVNINNFQIHGFRCKP